MFNQNEMKKKISIVVYFLVLFTVKVNCETDVFELLSKGLRNLTVTESKYAILVMGNTGSGKSTLVHYLARDPSKIEAIYDGGLYPKVIDHWDILPENISTTRSRTLVPELTIDEKKNVWYDCPGFQDTRSTEFEVANTYFVKTLTDRIENLKIILTVNHASVMIGQDRKDFPNLMKFGVTLLQTVEKFDVGLVITKAESARVQGWKVIEVTNEDVINETVKFLNEYLNNLQGDPLKEKKKKLVENFLHKSTDGKYDHIGVFYKPVENGTFDKIPKMAKERVNILNIVYNNVKYAKTLPNDFGYPLSVEAKSAIERKSKEINQNIDNTLKQIALFLWNEIKRLGDRKSSAQARKKIYTDRLNAYKNLIANTSTTENVIDGMNIFATQMNIKINDADIENLLIQQNYENILKTISNHTVMMTSIDWVNCFSKMYENIVDESNWYSVFEQMSTKLTSYQIQQDTSMYNVQNLSDWGQKDAPQGLNIEPGNIDQFLVLIGSKPTSTLNLNMDSKRYDVINQALRDTLRTEMKITCEDDVLLAQGPFVILSKINLEQCDGASRVHILATEKFFVDNSTAFRDLDEFVVISENWEIRRVSLLDLSANSVEYSHPSNKDGTKEDPDGIQGKPGRSARCGANFYGFATSIFFGDRLTVKINGGDGGRGQDGSRAYPEIPEIDKTKLENFKNCDMKNYLMTTDYHYRTIDGRDLPNCWNRDAHYFYDDEKWKTYSPIHARADKDVHKEYSYTLYARQCCKEDGLAGLGGFGGIAGKKIIDYNAWIGGEPKFVAINGRNGMTGKNPDPCSVMKKSFKYKTMCKRYVKWTKAYGYDDCRFSFTYSDPEIDDKCPKRGRYINYNSKGVVKPTRAITEYARVMTLYKALLRNNMDKTLDPALRVSDLRSSYYHVEKDTRIEKHYDLIDYINDMDVLEDQFSKLNDRVDFQRFYESLLKRIDKYASQKTTEEKRKVTTLLYIACLTKTHTIRTGELTNMIIDVIGFLDLSLKNRQSFQDMERATKVYDRRRDYEKNIEAMIDEANDFIEKDINIYLSDMSKTLKLEFDAVISETIRLKRETYGKMEEKAKALEKLKENIRIRSLLRIFDVLGQGLGYAGKEGQLIGKVIKFGTTTARAVMEDPEKVFQQKVPLPTAVNGEAAAKKFFEANRDKTISTIGEIITELSKSLQLNGAAQVNKERKSKIDEFKRKFDEAKGVKNVLHCERIQKELEAYIKKEKELIEGKKEKSKGDEEFFKRIEHTRHALAIATSNVDLYKESKGDQEKLDAAKEAIANDQTSLQKLHDFEGMMYKNLLPNLIELQQSVEKTRKSLVSKSPIALNVINWKISNSLRDAKRDMTEIFRGFSNEERIGLVMDKLMGGMTMIINIYTQIREYDEHIRLIQYLGDLHAIHFKQIHIRDENLSNAFNQLQFNIQSNIVIGQYLRVVDAFKQIAFPYAASYLDLFQLPTAIVEKTSKDIKNQTELIANRLDGLKTQILSFNQTVINNHDKDIFSSKFGTRKNVEKPFCVWKSEVYPDEFSNLLSGKEIALMADVKDGPAYNAIKFRRIEIDFIAKNGADQKEIDRLRKSVMFSLTHSGLSRYRCGTKFYRINTPPQVFEFGKVNDVEIPSKTNLVYDKILQGGFMLSPFTLWRIKMSGDNVAQLGKYKNMFDIELNGNGQYVRQNAPICSTYLEKYYKIDDSIIRV